MSLERVGGREEVKTDDNRKKRIKDLAFSPAACCLFVLRPRGDDMGAVPFQSQPKQLVRPRPERARTIGAAFYYCTLRRGTNGLPRPHQSLPLEPTRVVNSANTPFNCMYSVCMSSTTMSAPIWQTSLAKLRKKRTQVNTYKDRRRREVIRTRKRLRDRYCLKRIEQLWRRSKSPSKPYADDVYFLNKKQRSAEDSCRVFPLQRNHAITVT